MEVIFKAGKNQMFNGRKRRKILRKIIPGLNMKKFQKEIKRRI
jgi:hypothetical protein